MGADLSSLAGIGDTAVALLKAGADFDKKDSNGQLALDLAPDKEVRPTISFFFFARPSLQEQAS